jgi:hypothetical protein
MNMYNSDPYAHAEAFDYDAQYRYDQSQMQHQQQHQYPPNGDYPTQDEGNGGYTDLQRGHSIGSGSGHGHGHAGVSQSQHQVYPGEFPMTENYLGRPTGGSDGP